MGGERTKDTGNLLVGERTKDTGNLLVGERTKDTGNLWGKGRRIQETCGGKDEGYRRGFSRVDEIFISFLRPYLYIPHEYT
jgi:hypothetical protein